MFKKLIIIFSLAASCIFFSGCVHFYTPPIQQGNILHQSDIDQLKAGMSKKQVQAKLGNPILAEVFDPNVWTYVYMKSERGKVISKKVVIYFKNNQLTQIQK